MKRKKLQVPNIIFLFLSGILLPVIALPQWNPDAGVIPSYTLGATVITSSGTSGQNAIDNDENTAWQGGQVLPAGYLSRPDNNILYGLGSSFQCRNSGNAPSANITDGNLTSVTQIPLSGGKAWVRFNFISPIFLRHVSLKCGVAATIKVFAYHPNGDSTFLGSIETADNFKLKRFSPMLANVSRIKIISAARISVFEIGALSNIPTEYLIVDLGQSKEVGYIETRHWSDSGAVATAVYLSNNNINWTLVSTLNPNALQEMVSRPAVPMQARYVKVQHSMVEEDYAKCYVWEVRVYDKNGPFGAFPSPKPHYETVAGALGVNGIWGWGRNMFSNSIPQGQGPTKFNQISTHARNYHNMHWDVDDPDLIPDYANQPFGLALWWLDWDREYQAWNDAGLKVQASIQFNEWIPTTRMAMWNNPYVAAYNYGYAFARHFGPTNGNGLVDVIEMGNEPWTYPASFYLEVLRGMLHGVKDGDPALKAIPCALQAAYPDAEYPMGGNYMGARLTQSEAPLIDGINVHHYSYTHDAAGTRIAVYPEHPESDMKAVVNDIRFRDKNLPGKKIYLSEWGWDSDGGSEGCLFGECVSEYEQAIYGVRGAMMFLRLGIDRLTWYFYGNQGSGNLYSRSGMEGSAAANFADKQSFRSFKSFVHLLGERHFLDTLREDNTAWIYLFGDSLGNPTHIAAWRPVDGNNTNFITVNLPTTLLPDSAWTITGNTGTGELVAAPAYNAGVMSLQISSAPLVIKVTPDVSLTNFVWTGNISGNWNSPLNWNTYTVPTANTHVMIPAGRPHYPDSYSANPVAATLAIHAGATVTLTPGFDLTVNDTLVLDGGTLSVTGIAGTTPLIHLKGNVVRTAGTFNHGNGKVILDGTSLQTISGNFSFYHVAINNASGVQALSPVSVSGILSVMTGSTLTTNNNVTVESGGSVMHGQDTPGNQQGNINGNIIVKRKGSSNPQIYNYWSSPVQNASVNTLGGSGNRYYYDPSLALDTTENGLRSGWVTATGTMTPALGYISRGSGMVSFNGASGSFPVANAARVTVKKNEGVNNNVAFNLVGNPFPSSMDAALFLDKNGPNGSGEITGALYFWDDDGSGGSSWNAVQDYAVWNRAGLVAGPNSGTIFNGQIASGQSFFVEKMNDGSGTLVFDNTMRTTENNAFFRMLPVERLWVSLTNPANDYNETLIAFMDDATDAADPLLDAKKLNGNAGIAFYTKMNGRNYAIQSLAPLSTEKIIPLGFKSNVSGMHTLALKQLENLDESVVVLLEDKTLGVFQNLRLSEVYSFSSAAGTFDSRFYLHFNPAMEISAMTQECNEQTGSISISQPGSRQWNVVVKDVAGNAVHTQNGFSGMLFIDVAPGTYSVECTDNSGYTFSKNIEVASLRQAASDFNFYYRLRTPEIGSIIYFSDNSSGADFNEWNFGDGTSATNEQRPTHVYSRTGLFNVTLRVGNDDCESVSTKTIFITGNAVGNTQPGRSKTSEMDAEKEESIFVFADEKDIFIAFDFAGEYRAAVHVYDAAGRMLTSAEVVTKDVQRIPMQQLAQAVYFVKVVTAEKTFTGKVIPGSSR